METIVDDKAGFHRVYPSIKVAVRVRPMSQTERAKLCPEQCAQVDVSGSQVRLMKRTSALEPSGFAFDHVYDYDATQHAIYEDLGRPLVKHAFKGRTCLLFAYGATGSGKTHSLTGNTLNPGISTRLFCEVFDTISLLQQSSSDFRSTITVSISHAEIYNESVQDLLEAGKMHSRRSTRPVAFHEQLGGMNPDGTTEYAVTTPEEMCKYKELGDQAWKSKRHKLNCSSASLSHTIFSIHIRRTNHAHAPLQDDTVGHIHIIDLASSNVSAHLQRELTPSSAARDACDDARTREMMSAAAVVDKCLSNLNASLGSLAPRSAVARSSHTHPNLHTHSDDKNKLFAHLLKGAHLHSCTCVVLACISPALEAIGESILTLEFASR